MTVWIHYWPEGERHKFSPYCECEPDIDFDELMVVHNPNSEKEVYLKQAVDSDGIEDF